MTLEVNRGEGPSTHFGTTWGGRKGSSGERPSVTRTREGLKGVFDRFSPETLGVIQRVIEQAKREVGDDPVAIAQYLQTQGDALVETSKFAEFGATLADVANAIELSKGKVN